MEKPMAKKKTIKPKLLIGSSSESKALAEAFQKALKPVANAIGWWETDEFESMRSTLSALIDASQEYDFGLFLLTGDDTTISRKKAMPAPRDNVLFEFGLFLGSIGEKRTFPVIPNQVPVKTPSDLKGITIIQLQDDRELKLAVKDAVKKIASLIEKRGRRQSRYLLAKSWGYDEKSFEFSMWLDAVKLTARKDRLHNKQFAIVARKHDDRIPFENDTRIAIGDVIDIPEHSNKDLFVAVRAPDVFRSIKDEDRIDGQLILIPLGTSIDDCNSFIELLQRGGELLDSVGVTVRICD
jgi:Predicted nucleotide-binding protein containing TIR-like domain